MAKTNKQDLYTRKIDDMGIDIKDSDIIPQKLLDVFANLKQTAMGAGNYIKNNPAMSIGLGGTGLANFAGLVDNDNVGGQLLGLGGGAGLGFGLLPKLIPGISPQAQALTMLGGGTLGSLFDALRQKQEDEYAAQQVPMYR